MLTLLCFDDASQNLVVLVQVALVTKEFPSQKKWVHMTLWKLKVSLLIYM